MNSTRSTATSTLASGTRAIQKAHRVARLVAGLAFCLASTFNANAAEIGHFNGGLINIRDYFMPPPGVYSAVYHYFYTTNRINDKDGDKVDSVTITTPNGTPLTLDVDVDVDLYILAPAVLWISDWKIFGAQYGALVVLPFANTSLNAAVSTATGRGGDVEAGDFNIGDMMIQPLWLDWSKKHWDITLAYALYLPVGKYNTDNFDLPGGETVEVEDPDNIGYGFWTNQFQSAVAWYPREDRSTAVTGSLTYELHSNKEDFDLRPGDALTLTYGVSQYLPLKKDHTLLLELGLAGYDTWQTTDDHGDDAANDTHDSVHGIGAQAGLTYIPWGLAVNSHYFYEYAAEDRTQGHAVGLSISKHLWSHKPKEAAAESKQARRWRTES